MFYLRLKQWTFRSVLLTSVLASACAHRQENTSTIAAAPQKTEGQAVVTSVKGNAQVIKSEKNAPEMQPMFDGKTLAGWKETEFGGAGPVMVQDGQIILRAGVILTGINWTNPTPTVNYEISLVATKLDGSDFFCGLTFPVKDTHCTFIVGGWGGGVVGISNIDGMDASENQTSKVLGFQKNRPYKIRVRVTEDRLKAWIDDEEMADVPIKEHKLGMRLGEIELSKPLGIATYQTSTALKDITLKRIGK